MSGPRRSWPFHCRAALVAAIRAAAEQFPPPGEDQPERVHEARKALKAAAAQARLFKPLAGAPAVAALAVINMARRRVGRARDLDILAGVLAKIGAPAATQEILLRAVAEQREAARRAHRETEAAGVSAELAELARSVEGWDLGSAGAPPLLAAIRRTYRAARRIGRRAMATRLPEDLHALRGRVVDLSHQLAVFEPAWPAMFQTMARELHRLRTTLGDDNDLTILADFARAHPELQPAELDALDALIARRRRPLERRAAERFARLFAERPAAFERRIAAYLERPQRKPRARRTPLADAA